MNLARVMIADDHLIVAESICKLLETECEVVATVTDGYALLKAASIQAPDLILLDIAMPLLNGLEAGRQLKEKMPAVKLIFLTMNEDPDLAREAFLLGASGYLLKKSAASELLQAIRAVSKGKIYISPQIARAMEDAFILKPDGGKTRKMLTQRQREVMQLLAEGKSMKEAGNILSLTARTVAFHKYRMMEGLGFKTTADLIQYAVKYHVVVN
jgi:DNA-binding NarL/FixJ family response regulator